MMFNFIVKYLGFLKNIPLLAGALDALLMLWNFALNPEITNSIERIEKEISMWKGVRLAAHKFGGAQFNFNAKEFGHIHSNGILDILFSKNIKCTLLQDGKVADHHIFHSSGWISFYIRSEKDIEKAIALLRLSYEIKNVNTRRNPVTTNALTGRGKT